MVANRVTITDLILSIKWLKTNAFRRIFSHLTNFSVTHTLNESLNSPSLIACITLSTPPDLGEEIVSIPFQFSAESKIIPFAVRKLIMWSRVSVTRLCMIRIKRHESSCSRCSELNVFLFVCSHSIYDVVHFLWNLVIVSLIIFIVVVVHSLGFSSCRRRPTVERTRVFCFFYLYHFPFRSSPHVADTSSNKAVIKIKWSHTTSTPDAAAL